MTMIPPMSSAAAAVDLTATTGYSWPMRVAG